MSPTWLIEGELNDTMPVQRRDGLEVKIAPDLSTADEQWVERDRCLKIGRRCNTLLVLVQVLNQVIMLFVQFYFIFWSFSVEFLSKSAIFSLTILLLFNIVHLLSNLFEW